MSEMPDHLEKVYDERIHPLMTEIIAICKEHGIPVLASFQYAPDSFVTTCIAAQPYANKSLGVACQLIREGFASFVTTRRT